MILTSAELRIGNYLCYTNDSDWKMMVQVVTIGKDFFYAEWDEIYPPLKCDTYEPIEITFELLTKIGFIDTANNGWGARLELNSTDELAWYKQDHSLRFQTKGSGFTRDFNVKYIHQLQNLFFVITGKELTFKTK